MSCFLHPVPPCFSFLALPIPPLPLSLARAGQSQSADVLQRFELETTIFKHKRQVDGTFMVMRAAPNLSKFVGTGVTSAVSSSWPVGDISAVRSSATNARNLSGRRPWVVDDRGAAARAIKPRTLMLLGSNHPSVRNPSASTTCKYSRGAVAAGSR